MSKYIQMLDSKQLAIHSLSIVLVSFLCLHLSWYFQGLWTLSLCSLVPLFLIRDWYPKQCITSLILIYPGLLCWNALSLYWLYNTGYAVKITGLIFINAALALIPFIFLFRYGLVSFILSWLVMEYCHLHFEIGFPLLALGHILTKNPAHIQWYEFTGMLGGTLWILSINVLIYLLIFQSKSKGKKIGYALLTAASILTPLLISQSLYKSPPTASPTKINVAALQTNLKCRSEKYAIPQDSLIDYYLSILDKLAEDTDVLVFPETAIPNLGYINKLDGNKIVAKILKQVTQKAPNAQIVLGAATNDLSPRSDEFRHSDENYNSAIRRYYRTFNSVLSVDQSGLIGMRHKAKLVPFNEKIPYSNYLGFLRAYFNMLGPYSFSLKPGGDLVFSNTNARYNIASAICYESLFGDFFREFAQKGGEFITVSLNEGWYDNLAGKNRFKYISAARAIETRRDIIRSSNCGYASFTDAKGNIKTIKEPTGVLYATATPSKIITFYTQYGDYLGSLSSYMLCFIILFSNKKLKLCLDKLLRLFV